MSQSRRWDPSRRFIAIFLAVSVLLLAAGLGARPMYRAFKHQRAQGMADDIDEFLQTTNLIEAGRLIRVAITLDPKDPRIARQAAEYLTQAGSPDSLNYWELLMGLGKATREDRVRYIRICLDFARIEVAQNALKELLLKDPRDVDALELSVRLLQMKGDLPRARLASLAALSIHPLNEQFQFLAGALLAGTSTNLAERAQGRRLLWGLAIGDNPQHDAALALLSGNAELERGENEVLIRTLLSRTNVTVADRLAVANIRVRMDPQRRQAIVAETLEQVRTRLSLDERRLVGGWLVSAGFADQALEIVPASLAGTNTVLVSLRLEAMAAAENWKLLQPAIEPTNTPGNPVLLACLRGLVAKANGREAVMGVQFEEANRLAARNPAEFLTVARYAERAGLTNVAVDAWRHLTSYPSIVLQATRELVRLADGLEDLRVMRDAIGRVAELVPSDPVIVGRLSYLNLLLNENPAAQRDVLQRLGTAHPTNSTIRLTRAFAEWRTGNAAGALTLLEQEPMDWDKAEQRWLAVYVGVLAANEQREAARQMARKLKPEALKASERDLVRGLL